LNPQQNEPRRTSTRVFALIAEKARTAVLLRRGPSKQVRMLKWDLASDDIVPGQWLSGQIYNERCGLSPDGELLIYFCGKFKTKLGTFTAVCRPPYFTALALWPDGSTWGGGGFFEGDRKVVLKDGDVGDELNGGQSIPPHVAVTTMAEYHERHPPAPTPESAQGWTLVQRGSVGEQGDGEPASTTYEKPWISVKRSPRNSAIALERKTVGRAPENGPATPEEYRLVYHSPMRGKECEPQSEDMGRLDFAGWDHDGSLLYSLDGIIHRRRLGASLAERQPPADIVADLRDQKFQNIKPPAWASTWP